MAFKLAISDKVLTAVSGFYTDDKGVHRKFDFKLEQDRMNQAALKAAVTNRGEDAVEVIKSITTGWRDQRLVLTEDDKPAEFSAEALDALLSISGMGAYCWQAYLTSVLAHEKN